MKIKDDVMNVLARSTTSGCALYLPPEQLDRNLYVATNKIIESIGGAWNRKEKAHLFDHDPEEDLEQIINTGEWTDIKKEYQFFETPKEVAIRMIEMADIREGDVLLEPSVGQGAILNHFPKGNKFYACELNDRNCDILESANPEVRVLRGDFLQMDFEVNKVIMNPPFSKQQDIDHVLHAWDCLKPDGILVSIVSESPFFRNNKKSVLFREWLTENDAEIIDLPAGTFKDSGTMIRSKIIKVQK